MSDHDDIGEAAFHSLRHYSPETVRTIRISLDSGIEAANVQKTLRRHLPAKVLSHVLAALGYMVFHPDAGAVEWVDGSYVFRDISRAEGIAP